MNINELERTATQVRRDIIRMVHGCQSGHPGGSLGATDIVTALYFDQMDIDPAHFRMDGNGEDVFFDPTAELNASNKSETYPTLRWY